MENIDQIHNEFLSFTFAGGNGLNASNEIDCPFVPDIIKVTGFSDCDYTAGATITCSCSAFSNKIIAIISETNNFNHTITFTNKARQTFQGSYRFDFKRLDNSADAYNGFLGLTLEFIRLKNIDP